jgi:hypothetical protein
MNKHPELGTQPIILPQPIRPQPIRPQPVRPEIDPKPEVVPHSDPETASKQAGDFTGHP